MQVATTINKPDGIIVKRVSVPVGLEEIMEGLTKEVLRKKPKDLYKFAYEYFSRLLALRQEKEFKEKVHTVQSAIRVEGIKPKPSEKVAPRRQPRQISRQISVRKEEVSPITEKKDHSRRITQNRQNNSTSRSSVSQTKNRGASVDSNQQEKSIGSNKTTKIPSNQSTPRDKSEMRTARKRSTSRESTKSKSSEKSLKANAPKIIGENKNQNTLSETTKMVAIIEGIEKKGKSQDRVETIKQNDSSKETREVKANYEGIELKNDEDKSPPVSNTEVTENSKDDDKEPILEGSGQQKAAIANQVSADEVDKTKTAFTDVDTKTLESVKEYIGESSSTRVFSMDKCAQKEGLDMIEKSNLEQEVEKIESEHLSKETFDDKIKENINSVQAFAEKSDLKNSDFTATIFESSDPVAALEEYVGKSGTLQIKSVPHNETNVANSNLSKSEMESKETNEEIKVMEKESDDKEIDQHNESQMLDSQKQLIKHSKNDVESVKSPPDKIEENVKDKIAEDTQISDFVNIEKKDDLINTEFTSPKIGKEVVDDLIKENEKLNSEIYHELEKIKSDIDQNKEEFEVKLDKQTFSDAKSAENQKQVQNLKKDSENEKNEQTSVASFAQKKDNFEGLKENKTERIANVLPADIPVIGHIPKSDITKFIQNENLNVFKDTKSKQQDIKLSEETEPKTIIEIDPANKQTLADSDDKITDSNRVLEPHISKHSIQKFISSEQSHGNETVVNTEIAKESKLGDDDLIKTEKQTTEIPKESEAAHGRVVELDTQIGRELEDGKEIVGIQNQSVKPVTCTSDDNETSISTQIHKISQATNDYESENVIDVSTVKQDVQIDNESEVGNNTEGIETQLEIPVALTSDGNNKTMVSSGIGKEIEAAKSDKSEIADAVLIKTVQDNQIDKELEAVNNTRGIDGGNKTTLSTHIIKELGAGNYIMPKTENHNVQIALDSEAADNSQVVQAQSVKPVTSNSTDNETLVHTQIGVESEARNKVSNKTKKQDSQNDNKSEAADKSQVVEVKPVTFDSMDNKTKVDAQIDKESEAGDKILMKTKNQNTEIGKELEAGQITQVAKAQLAKLSTANSAGNESMAKSEIGKESEAGNNTLQKNQKIDSQTDKEPEVGNKTQIVDNRSGQTVTSKSADNETIINNQIGKESEADSGVSIKIEKNNTQIGKELDASNESAGVKAQSLKSVTSNSVDNESMVNTQIDKEPETNNSVKIKTKKQDSQIGKESNAINYVLIKTEKQDSQVHKVEAGNKTQVIETQLNKQSSPTLSDAITDSNSVLVPHIAKESIQKFISSEQSHVFRKTVEEETIDPKISYVVGEMKDNQESKVNNTEKAESVNKNKQLDEVHISNVINTAESLKIENNTKEKHDFKTATADIKTSSCDIVTQVNKDPNNTAEFLENGQEKALKCANLNQSNNNLDKTSSTAGKLSNENENDLGMLKDSKLSINECGDKFLVLEKNVLSENMIEGVYFPLKEYQEDKIIQDLKKNNEETSLDKENINSFILNEQKHALPDDKLSPNKELVDDKGIYIPLKDYDDEKTKSKLTDGNSNEDVIIAKTLLSSINNLNKNISSLVTKSDLDNSTNKSDMDKITTDDKITDSNISSTDSPKTANKNQNTKNETLENNKETTEFMISENKEQDNMTKTFDLNKADEKLVTKIQALWRGYKFRKDAKKAKDPMQSKLSNNILEKQIKSSLSVSDAVTNGIIKMQAEVRGYLERKKFNKRKRELQPTELVGKNIEQSITSNNKFDIGQQSEKQSEQNLSERPYKKEIKTLFNEPMLDEVPDSKKVDVHPIETNNLIPETLLDKYKVLNNKESKINITETKNLEPEILKSNTNKKEAMVTEKCNEDNDKAVDGKLSKIPLPETINFEPSSEPNTSKERIELEKDHEKNPPENKNLIRSDTVYINHTLDLLNNDNIETMMSKFDPLNFGRSFSLADNTSYEDNTGKTVVVSEEPKDDNNNCENEVKIKNQIKSAIENISNTLHNMEKIKNEIISSKEFVELKNKNNLQENKDNLDEGKNFDVQSGSKIIAADTTEKCSFEESNKANSIKPINIQAEKSRLDALKGHVDLIDQVQNKILDQIAGRNTENAGKFDIDQLKKELEEAAALYKDIDEFSDIPFPMDHNDELLQYLSAFDMDSTGKFDLMVKKPRPIGLPDIKEEDGESKSDSTSVSDSFIVPERSIKDDEFSEENVKEAYEEEKDKLEKQLSILDNDVYDLHSAMISSPMHIEIKPKSTPRDQDYNKENITDLSLCENSNNSSSKSIYDSVADKLTDTAKNVACSLDGSELVSNNNLSTNVSESGIEETFKKENADEKNKNDPEKDLEKKDNHKDYNKTKVHESDTVETVRSSEIITNIGKDLESEFNPSKQDPSKTENSLETSNLPVNLIENSIGVLNKSDKEKPMSLIETELTTDKVASLQSQSKSLDTLTSEDNEDPFSLEKQSTIIERKPELTKIPKVLSKTISGSPRTLDSTENTPRSAKNISKLKRSASSDSKIPKKEPFTRKTSAGNLINSVTDKKPSAKILNKRSSSLDEEQSNTRLSRKGSAKNLGKIGKQKTIQETFKSKEIYDTKQKLNGQSIKEDSSRDEDRKNSSTKDALLKEKKGSQNVSHKTEKGHINKSLSKENKDLRNKSNEKDDDNVINNKKTLLKVKKELQNKSKEFEKADNRINLDLQKKSSTDIAELQRQPTVILPNKHNGDSTENLVEQNMEAMNQSLDTEQEIQNDSLQNSKQNKSNDKFVDENDSNDTEVLENRSKRATENDDQNILKDVKSSPETEKVSSPRDENGDVKTTFEANYKIEKQVVNSKLDEELSSDSLEINNTNNVGKDLALNVADELHDSLEDKSLDKTSPDSLHDSLEENFDNLIIEKESEKINTETNASLDKIDENIQAKVDNMVSLANTQKLYNTEGELKGQQTNTKTLIDEQKGNKEDFIAADNTELAVKSLNVISEAGNISQNLHTNTQSKSSNDLESGNLKSEESNKNKNKTSFNHPLDKDKKENSLDTKTNEELARREHQLNVSQLNDNTDPEQTSVFDRYVESVEKVNQAEAEELNQVHSDPDGSRETVKNLKFEESRTTSFQNVNNDRELDKNKIEFNHSSDEDGKENFLEKKTNEDSLKENGSNISQVNDNIDHELKNGISNSLVNAMEKVRQAEAEEANQTHNDPNGSGETVPEITEKGLQSTPQSEKQTSSTVANNSEIQDNQKPSTYGKLTRGSRSLDSALTGNENATSHEAPAGDAAVTSSEITSKHRDAYSDVTTTPEASKRDATRTHRLQSARAHRSKAPQRRARAYSASAQIEPDLKASSVAATQTAKCRVVFAPQENCGNSDIGRRPRETFGSMASGGNTNAEKKNNNVLDHTNNLEPQNMETQAATKIQAGFRGYQVRRQLKLKHESDKKQPKKNSPKNKPEDLEEKSAVKIQANVRGFLVRRRQKKQNNTASA